MEEQKKENKAYDTENPGKSGNKVTRRDVIKSLATLPVIGAAAYGIIKQNLQSPKKTDILNRLGFGSEDQIKQTKAAVESPVKGDTIKLGIIGAGNRGRALLREAGFMTSRDLAESKRDDSINLKLWLKTESLNVRLVGVCDVFEDNAENASDAATRTRESVANSSKTPASAKKYKTYQELLANKDIDAVIIATPDHHHAQMTIDAVNAGKHVYCEKCSVRTEEEVYRLVEAVKKSRVVYQLGHQSRHSPVYAKARELFHKNILGPVTLISTSTNRNTRKGAWIRHIDYTDGSIRPGNADKIDWKQWLGNSPYVPFSIERYYNWSQWFDYGNGPWGQLFSHAFDALNGVTDYGIPKTCMASGGIYYFKDGRETPDVFHAVYEYPDKGTTLMYSATLANGRNRGTILMGHDATMELGGTLSIKADPDSTRYKKEIESGLIGTAKPFVTLSPRRGNVDGLTSATSKYYEDLGLINAYINGQQVDLTYVNIKEWLNVIRNGGETSCNIDRAFEEGITICMATKSYKEKRTVEWDPVRRRII